MRWSIRRKFPIIRQLLTARLRVTKATNSSSLYISHMNESPPQSHNNPPRTISTYTALPDCARRTVRTSTKTYTYSSPNRNSHKRISESFRNITSYTIKSTGSQKHNSPPPRGSRKFKMSTESMIPSRSAILISLSFMYSMSSVNSLLTKWSNIDSAKVSNLQHFYIAKDFIFLDKFKILSSTLFIIRKMFIYCFNFFLSFNLETPHLTSFCNLIKSYLNSKFLCF